MKNLIHADFVAIFRNILDAKSADLYHHSLLTAEISLELVSFIDGLGMDEEDAYRAGLIHDIGKLYIPDKTLGKQGDLTTREKEVIMMHPLWGHQFAESVSFLSGYENFILCHHEKPDGSGYPFGITDIPFEVRLVTLSDQAAAFMEDRVYRRKITNTSYLKNRLGGVASMLFDADGATKGVMEVLDRVIENHIDIKNRCISVLKN